MVNRPLFSNVAKHGLSSAAEAYANSEVIRLRPASTHDSAFIPIRHAKAKNAAGEYPFTVAMPQMWDSIYPAPALIRKFPSAHFPLFHSFSGSGGNGGLAVIWRHIRIPSPAAEREPPASKHGLEPGWPRRRQRQ